MNCVLLRIAICLNVFLTDLIFLGDWHCAYVLLYGPRLLQLPADDKNSAADKS